MLIRNVESRDHSSRARIYDDAIDLIDPKIQVVMYRRRGKGDDERRLFADRFPKASYLFSVEAADRVVDTGHDDDPLRIVGSGGSQSHCDLIGSKAIRREIDVSDVIEPHPAVHDAIANKDGWGWHRLGKPMCQGLPVGVAQMMVGR
jgi:hypothetical protein